MFPEDFQLDLLHSKYLFVTLVANEMFLKSQITSIYVKSFYFEAQGDTFFLSIRLSKLESTTAKMLNSSQATKVTNRLFDGLYFLKQQIVFYRRSVNEVASPLIMVGGVHFIFPFKIF